MTQVDLLNRLSEADPGWREWRELLALVGLLTFEFIEDEYLGGFLSAGNRLTFADAEGKLVWPNWLPDYVPALYGMKADHYEMVGGYADSFTGEHTKAGSVFASGGNDQGLGFPLLGVPPDTYPFQSNSSGALFHINSDLEVLYPDADQERLNVLDSLKEFTRKNIQQALVGADWFFAYGNIRSRLLD